MAVDILSVNKGKKAELKACTYLEINGFKIITTNFYAKKMGEIDIIATKNDIFHFIEVKSAPDYETAILNITPSKLSKIKRSTQYYIQKEQLNVNFCIDAVIIYEDNIELIENITF